MATSTLAPVTKFFSDELDDTCMMARCITRWNPSVGCVSTSSRPGRTGVLSVMNLRSSWRNVSTFAAQARNTSNAAALSNSDNKRCSTVINSCLAVRASTKAVCRLTSSSSEITLPPLHIGADRQFDKFYSMTKSTLYINVRSILPPRDGDQYLDGA